MDRFVIKTKRPWEGDDPSSFNHQINVEMPYNDSGHQEHAQGIHYQLHIQVHLDTIEADSRLRLPIHIIAKTIK